MRGREEKELMLGAMGIEVGDEKSQGGGGGERQELHPGFALLALHRLWVKQRWENSAEAALEIKGEGCLWEGKKITKGSWRCIITITIC